MLVIQRAVLAVEEGDADDPCDLLDSMRDRFLIHGSRSPFSWAQRLRTYGKRVRDSTTTLGYVMWSDDKETLTYKDMSLSIVAFKDFVSRQVRECQQKLEALFLLHEEESRDEIVPCFHLRDIKDNAAEGERGWNFLKDPRNRHVLPDGANWMLNRVLTNDFLRDEFLYADPKSLKATWVQRAVDQYTDRVTRFLTQLLLLIHLTSGQPARGTEILSLRHTNTTQHRNIFVEDGLVSTVTTYHKGYNVTNSTKIIHRYLPKEVGELVVYYLWLILPFCRKLDLLTNKTKDAPSAFLWPKGKESWHSATLTRVLREQSQSCLGAAMNITVYRHVAIAMSRKHLRCGGFKRDYGLEENAIDKQSTHSTWTAGSIYARGLEEAAGLTNIPPPYSTYMEQKRLSVASC